MPRPLSCTWRCKVFEAWHWLYQTELKTECLWEGCFDPVVKSRRQAGTGVVIHIHMRVCVVHSLWLYASVHVYAWVNMYITHMHMHNYKISHINVHACMRIYTYSCIHTYIHAYIHAYIHQHTRTHIYIYICIYTHAYTYIHAYIHTYIHACMHACMHAYACRHAYTHIDTHRRTHAHIHRYIPVYKQTDIHICICHVYTRAIANTRTSGTKRRNAVRCRIMQKVPKAIGPPEAMPPQSKTKV